MEESKEKLNFSAKAAKYFLGNRVISILFLAAVLLGGIAAFIANPKAKDPEIKIPKFQVTFDYPGATAGEVEEFITKEAEEVIADIEGVKEINSVSFDGGQAVINVEFETYVSIEDAKIRVLSKLNEKEDIIRKSGLSSPVIKNLDSDALAILEFGFTSNVLTQNQTRELASDIMSELRKVPGVNNLEMKSGDRRALRIILDPGKMQVLDVSATNVINAIKASNIKIPSGIVRNGDKYNEIEVNGTLGGKESAEKILVKPGVQIRDIAAVEDYFPEKTSSSQIWKDEKIKDAVYITVAKVKGQDAIKVSKNTTEALDREMQKEKYKDIEYAILRNDGEKAASSAADLIGNLFTSMIMVLLTLIYFLNFRGALNVAVAIPLSIMIAFILGYMRGVVLSEVAFFGLILALGLFVDSTTVVVDGAYYYIQKGMEKKKAFIETLKETGGGLITSNLMTIIVFIPVAMISGTMGQYIFPAVFYIMVAIIGSTVLGFSLVPYIGSILLKKEKERKEDFIDKMGNKYVAALEKLLKSRKKQKIFIIGVSIAFVLAMLIPATGLIKQKSLSGGDTDEFSIFIDGPEGMDVAKTQEIASNVAEIVKGKQYVKSIQIFTAEPMTADNSSAARGSDSRNTPNVSSIKIKLEKELASDDFEKYVNDARADIFENEKAKKIMDDENVKIKVLADTPIPVFANIELKVKGSQKEIREKVANDLVSMVKEIKGAIHVDTSMEDAFPKVIYRIDHDKALASGVTAIDASDALQAAIGPLAVSQFHVPEIKEPATIELQFARENREEVSDLSKIFITNAQGDSVPLDSVVEKIETRNEPRRILDSRNPTTKVTAEVENVPSIDVTNKIAEKIENEYIFPEGGKLTDTTKEGFTFTLPNAEIYKIEWGGELKESNESNADLLVAMILAFSIIVIIFIYQYGSFKIPMIVVSSIPLGFIGVFPAFAILYRLIGLYYTSMATLGIIALMGIVVNNSILLIEYYDIAREKGMTFIDAFLESGRKRFRPIMLTTVTTILGNLVMIFDPTWNSLAWTIIFGLTVSTMLVIFLVPILYSFFCKR